MSLILTNNKNINVYKLVYVDDKFCKPFKSYLGKDAVYKFISIINDESIIVIWWKNILTKNCYE